MAEEEAESGWEAARTDAGEEGKAEPTEDEAGGTEVEICTDFPDGWAAIRTPNGEVYYWNQSTEETTWETPEVIADAGLAVTAESGMSHTEVSAVPHAPVVERPPLSGKYLRISECRDLGKLLTAMREDPEDSQLQDAALIGLKGFTHKSSGSKAAVVSGGGVQLVVSAMRKFPADVLVQESGVIVLRSLARRGDLLASLVEKGATDVCHAARRRFPTNDIIAERTELTVNEVYKGDGKCCLM